MYIVLSLYVIKDDFIAFYVSLLFCNNYLVDGCIYLPIYLFIFEPYVESISSLVQLFIEIDEHNSANFK